MKLLQIVKCLSINLRQACKIYRQLLSHFNSVYANYKENKTNVMNFFNTLMIFIIYSSTLEASDKKNTSNKRRWHGLDDFAGKQTKKVTALSITGWPNIARNLQAWFSNTLTPENLWLKTLGSTWPIKSTPAYANEMVGHNFYNLSFSEVIYF